MQGTTAPNWLSFLQCLPLLIVLTFWRSRVWHQPEDNLWFKLHYHAKDTLNILQVDFYSTELCIQNSFKTNKHKKTKLSLFLENRLEAIQTTVRVNTNVLLSVSPLLETKRTKLCVLSTTAVMRCCQTVYPCLSLMLSSFSECPWPLSLYDYKKKQNIKKKKEINELYNEDREMKNTTVRYSQHSCCTSFFFLVTITSHAANRCHTEPLAHSLIESMCMSP